MTRSGCGSLATGSDLSHRKDLFHLSGCCLMTVSSKKQRPACRPAWILHWVRSFAPYSSRPPGARLGSCSARITWRLMGYPGEFSWKIWRLPTGIIVRERARRCRPKPLRSNAGLNGSLSTPSRSTCTPRPNAGLTPASWQLPVPPLIRGSKARRKRWLRACHQMRRKHSCTRPPPRMVRSCRRPRARRSHALEINALVSDGCFSVTFTHVEALHSHAVVERLAAAFLDALRELARAPLPTRDAAVEDVYPLTPMQQGMLFHTLLDSGNSYVEQMSWKVTRLDVYAFGQAWDAL